MIALLLAAATLTPEAACAEPDLDRMRAAPAERRPLLRDELVRRAALVLAEERAVEEVAGRRSPWVDSRLPVALGLAGLCALLVPARRSRALRAAAAMALVGAAGLPMRALAHAQAASARVAELRACRLRLVDTRAALQQGDLARCLNDLNETDEDLMLFESNIRAGHPVELRAVEKLRGELSHRPATH
jgi:hypothetical protein